MKNFNETNFTSLENFNNQMNLDNCKGDACEFIRWEVLFFSGTNLIKEIKLTNTGESKVKITAAWGNVLGGCGVGPFNFTIEKGQQTKLNFNQNQMILGYCNFSANFIKTGFINNLFNDDFKIEVANEDNDSLYDFIERVKSGNIEPIILAESINGNQVWFWQEGNNSYLKILNTSNTEQRTDYQIRVKSDNNWRVHTTGYAIVQPNNEYIQGFHQWRAEDWTAQWL